MSNKSKYDVIVVGAGLIGAVFALRLAQSSDYRILVIERAERISSNLMPNQRVLALGDVATTALKSIGVFDKLQASDCYPYSRMFVWDDCSAGELEFTSKDYQRESLGHMVDAVSLTMLLQQAMDEHALITVNYQLAIDDLSLGTNNASIGENEAPLIVAADGANSWCRRKAKIFANKTIYQQKGIVARIQTEMSHEDTAWQAFLPTGPLGLLPLNNNQCSIVWSADSDKAEQLLAYSDTDFADALAQAIQGRLGKVELLSPRQTFPLLSMKAETYFKHRLVLIGDAAHSIHPLAGQGANLGFKDVEALVDQLVLVEKPNSLGDLDILSRYQRSRKADNEQTDWFMSAIYKAYQNDSGWWPAMRGSGMNWLSGSKRLKSILAKQAIG